MCFGHSKGPSHGDDSFAYLILIFGREIGSSILITHIYLEIRLSYISEQNYFQRSKEPSSSALNQLVHFIHELL